MMGRNPIAYVVEIDAGEVTLNLLDRHRGQIASHSQGVSPVTDVGNLLAINAGTRIIVLRVLSISFAEPREVHRLASAKSDLESEPLRHLKGVVAGYLVKAERGLTFTADSLCNPGLGAEAFPLTQEEFGAISGHSVEHAVPVNLGRNLRGEGPVIVGLTDLISKHVAVLGASGHGKSSFNAAVLQQLVALPNAHIVVFDMNGEYEQALVGHVPAGRLKVTTVGGPGGFQIPYFALGRQGLLRLLLPSEKTQKPALTFAIESLNRVIGFPGREGFGLVGDINPRLFDDCRNGGADQAATAIECIRNGTARQAENWPGMAALSALAAESYSLAQARGTWERNAFSYGNLAPLIARIRRLVEDERFQEVVAVNGGPPLQAGQLSWIAESRALVEDIFGNRETPWTVHIVNLRHIAQDLMPLVLGSLLELYASELFHRGQGVSPETLLVLEEAHHYLRPVGSSDDARDNALAYERLAKEGRKFGLALWISTQRPSEVSPTVLSQCGTWACFRLTTEADLNAVANATEWAERRDIRRIAGLAKRNAVLFGSGVAMPTLLESRTAAPPPLSADPNFDSWAAE
jgi:DNA helicase HerA-like ATPase